MQSNYRIEADSMGEMKVPADAYYGAQTARAVENFPISNLRFSRQFIRALGLIKKHAAATNAGLGYVPPNIAQGRAGRPRRKSLTASGTTNSSWIFSRPAPAPRPT